MSFTEKIFDFIGKWIIITLGILASVGSFISMFEIIVNVPVMILTTISVTGIFLAISKLRRRVKVTITLVLIFAMTVFIVVMRMLLLTGVYSIANSVIFKYNEYFPDSAIGYFEFAGSGVCNTYVVAIAVIIYSYILVTATWYKMFASIHILLSVLFVVPGMILGMMPNSLFVSMLIIYYMFCFMCQHSRRVYPARLLALVSVSLVIIGLIFIFSPPSSYDAAAKYKDIYKKLNDISEKYNLDDLSMNKMKKVLGDNESVANGGINGGLLGDIGEVKYLEKTMLKISASPDDNVLYLKGFVGTEYDKRQWHPISYDNINKYKAFCSEMRAQGYDSDYYEGVTVSPDFEIFEGREQHAIYIYYTGADKEYRYIPYFSDILSRSDAFFHYGIRPASNFTEYYDYTYVSLSEEEIYEGFRADLENEYVYEYVKETNLSVPQNLQTLFGETAGIEKDCYDGTAQGLIDCVNQVRNYLADNTSYTLSPGILDADRDYVEDFLTNKKEGYCTAYASSATLMLRYMGVPARYVEGYIVRPSDYRRIDNKAVASVIDEQYLQHSGGTDYGYIIDKTGLVEADIKDNSAHAWVEVYVPGIGFAPIEMTPGYESSNGGGNGTGSTGQSGNGENQTTTKKEAEDTTTSVLDGKETTTIPEKDSAKTGERNTGGRSKTGEGKFGGRGIGFIISIFAGIIIVAVISLAVYKIVERNKKKYDYDTEDIRGNILVLGRILDKCLDRLHISHSKNINVRELEAEIKKRTNYALSNNKKILRGSEETKGMLLYIRDTDGVIDIINRCRYGGENAEFTDEEFEKVRYYVEEFKKSLQYLKNKV